MSYSLFFLLSIILFNYSFCDLVGCKYKTSSAQTKDNADITDGNYLKDNDEDENMQKCFLLSNSDVNPGECCYYKDASNNNKQSCYDKDSNTGISGICPTESKIINNCGMALYYQPITAETCTEISLVDGYCCFVKTTNQGKACVSQKTIDEDKKNEITDDIINYIKKFNDLNPAPIIESVVCKGSYEKYYGFLLLLTIAVMF